MRVINIELERLSMEISKLITLKLIWSASKVGRSAPIKTGEGKMAEELQQLGEAFEYMSNDIDELLEASIRFFRNIEKEYKGADERAASSAW